MTVDVKHDHRVAHVADLRDVSALGSLVLGAARRALAVHLVESATRLGTDDRSVTTRLGKGERS